MADQMGTGVLGPGLTTALAAKTDKVGGSLTNATEFSTTAACTALLGGATASAQSSLAISATKTIAVPAAISVWRGLDFQASTLTLTAGGVAPSSLSAVYFAAPTITSPAAYVIPTAATVTIAGPPTAAGATTITNPRALHVVSGFSTFGGPLFLDYDGDISAQLLLRDTRGTPSLRYNAIFHIDGAAGVKLSAYDTTGSVYLPVYYRGSRLALNDIVETGNVLIGTATDAAATKLNVEASKTIASAAGAVWDGVKFAASTATITGATGITALSFHKIEAPTISGDTAGLVIGSAATLTITGPPVAGNANTTITDALALNVVTGLCRLGSEALIGVSGATQFRLFSTGNDVYIQNTTAAGAMYFSGGYGAELAGAFMFVGNNNVNFGKAAGCATGVDIKFEGSSGNILTGHGNVVLGATAAGATAAKCLALSNSATAPSASADLCHLYCADNGAGHATLAVYQEEVVSAIGAEVVTEFLPVLINGVVKHIALTA